MASWQAKKVVQWRAAQQAVSNGNDLGEVRSEAIVRPSLYGEAYASGAALLAEPDCLCNIAGGMAGQRIVQIAHKVVSVVQRKGHECAAHQDEFHLHGRMMPQCQASAIAGALFIKCPHVLK